MRLTELPEIKLWIDQFNEKEIDQELAKELVEKLHYVSANRLVRDFRELLRLSYLNQGVTALFVERELQKTRGKISQGMYREDKVRIEGRRRFARRAVGAALPVVKSLRNASQEVGSEGVIAQVLTQICALNSMSFLLQPSADEIRRKAVRHLVVVTDFIASGDRACKMLDSLWRLSTVRSWKSGKFIRLTVMAFTGTSAGIAAVKRHSSRPDVQIVMDCPTIGTSFAKEKIPLIEDLCERYAKTSDRPLGYGKIGALVAFEHSCPNNAPAIFTESVNSLRRPWRALFERRSTSQLFAQSPELSRPDLQLLFETLGFPTIAGSPAFIRCNKAQKHMYLVLAALSRRQRTTQALIRSTGLTLLELKTSLDRAESLGLTQDFRLLNAGRKELARLERSKPRKMPTKGKPLMYHPTALRAPIK